jgi:putative ABC transport system permease protein
VARLRPNLTIPEADAALQVVVARLQQSYPQTNTRMGAGITPLHEFLVGRTRLPLLVMLAAVGVLLLIACGNVANLLLVRAAGRDRELALRLALGAGRSRLVRQFLAESVVLATLGGVIGFGLGWWGIRILSALRPDDLTPMRELSISPTVLLYVVGATALAALVFGVVPALRGRNRAPGDSLRDGGRAAGGTIGGGRFADVLLVAQVGLAIALTLGAGLLTRSYLLLSRVEPGFDPRGVLAVRVGLPSLRYDSPEKVTGFFDELRHQAARIPGATAAGLVSRPPLDSDSWTSEFTLEGREPFPKGTEIVHRETSAGYQETMRVPVLAGRLFTDADRRGSPFVVIVNQTFARRFFPGADPVGHRIAFDHTPDSSSVWRTIVGVVGDERQASLASPIRPEVIAPYSQEGRSAMTLMIRTDGSPAALVPAVRRVIAGMDSSLAIASISTMEEIRRDSLARDRFLMTLVATFAVVGLVLGLVGVYGVVAQVARRRTQEIGIRIALGARARQVRWLVLRRGVGLTGLGIAVGVGGALAVTGAIRSLLYQVAPADPLTFVTIPALVLATAAAASWLPALGASRTDPSQALRE